MANSPTARFQFLAHAFEGTGGFAPQVTYLYEGGTTGKRTPSLSGPSELIPYTRESAEKFAGRNAVAVYENHLRTASERFVAFLGRRKPQRDGVDSPLVKLLLEDADLRGSSLDTFLQNFALNAKGRGSMLLLMDMPPADGPSAAPAVSLADQIARRKVPCLRAINPESVADYDLDADTGLFLSVTINCREKVPGTDGKESVQDCKRIYDATTWKLMHQDRVVSEGVHKFGQCPVLAFTENGGLFPQIGKYAQIADLSRRLFNVRSELDEILRSQTFSLLTYNRDPQDNQFDPAATAAIVGTHSMLVYSGTVSPQFIAPDAGPAETYLKKIAELEIAIKRISMDDATEQGAQAESGIARRMRFEALNADIATFATQMQQLERRVWALFHRAIATTNRVVVTWPSDYNLIDTMAEVDILDAFMRTGMPPAVLAEKRRAIVAGEFDGSDEETKAELMRSIDEMEQEQQEPPEPDPGAPPDPNPNPKPDQGETQE